MNRISEFRKATNLTQREFAEKLNITQGAIGHYEVGKRNPTLETAKKIVALINAQGVPCSLDDLFPAEN